MKVRDLFTGRVDLTREAERAPLGTLHRLHGSDETVPDRGWHQRDEPNLWDELREAAHVR